MRLFTNFLNPSVMDDSQIIEMTEVIVKKECLKEIKNVIGGVLSLAENQKVLKNDGDVNKYIDFMRNLQNTLDKDHERLQSLTHYFHKSHVNDKRTANQSHPIIKLYILIISFNTCFKNHLIYEYKYVEAILSAKKQANIEKEILEIRKNSTFYSNHVDEMLKVILEISDFPERVLNL